MSGLRCPAATRWRESAESNAGDTRGAASLDCEDAQPNAHRLRVHASLSGRLACVSMPLSVEIASPVVAEISDDSLPPEPAPMRKPQGKFGPHCKYKTEAEMRAAQAAYDAVQELIARRKRVLARRRQSQKRARDPVGAARAHQQQRANQRPRRQSIARSVCSPEKMLAFDRVAIIT